MNTKLNVQFFFKVIYKYIYIYIYTTDRKFGTSPDCVSKFIIKANVTIDHKIQSEWAKKKQELFTHLHTAW